MHFSPAISAIVALGLTSSVHAAFASVKNYCKTSVYITSVASEKGPTTEVVQNGVWSEKLWHDPHTGIAINIATTENGIYTGAPQIIFSYTLNGDLVYYDLNTLYGNDPKFMDGQLLVTTPGVDCPSISWPQEQKPAGDSVKACKVTDLLLTLCAP